MRLSSSETLRLQTAQAQKYMQQEQEDAQNEAKVARGDAQTYAALTCPAGEESDGCPLLHQDTLKQ